MIISYFLVFSYFTRLASVCAVALRQSTFFSICLPLSEIFVLMFNIAIAYNTHKGVHSSSFRTTKEIFIVNVLFCVPVRSTHPFVIRALARNQIFVASDCCRRMVTCYLNERKFTYLRVE